MWVRQYARRFVVNVGGVPLLSNFDKIESSGTPPTFTTNRRAYCLTHIQTYHWHDGEGSPGGTLWLTGHPAVSGLPARIGPFHAKTSSGQDGAPNVNWYADIPQSPPTVIDGTYTCNDSNTATWSANKGSGGQGFCFVY